MGGKRRATRERREFGGAEGLRNGEWHDERDDAADGPEFVTGPYDADEAPDDDLNRLDLGSMLLPIPDGAQLQVEVDTTGPVRAVHLMTSVGQVTVTAFAAPRSGGLWREVSRELVSRLRADGARVSRVRGEWGDEIDAVTGEGPMRFLAVEGPRWLLRGVAVGPEEQEADRLTLLRDVVRETVVLRGPEPMPVRSPLPLQLPEPLAQQLKDVTAGPAGTDTGRGA